MKKIFVFIVVVSLSLNLVFPVGAVDSVDIPPFNPQDLWDSGITDFASIGYVGDDGNWHRCDEGVAPTELVLSSIALTALGLTALTSMLGLAINGPPDAVIASVDRWLSQVSETARDAFTNIGNLIASGLAWCSSDVDNFTDAIDEIRPILSADILDIPDFDYTTPQTVDKVVQVPTGEYSMSYGLDDSFRIPLIECLSTSEKFLACVPALNKVVTYGLLSSSYGYYMGGGSYRDEDLTSLDDFASGLTMDSVLPDSFSAVSGDWSLHMYLSAEDAYTRSVAVANSSTYFLTESSCILPSADCSDVYISDCGVYTNGLLSDDLIDFPINAITRYAPPETSYYWSEISTPCPVQSVYNPADNITDAVADDTVTFPNHEAILVDDAAVYSVIGAMSPEYIQSLIDGTATVPDSGTGDVVVPDIGTDTIGLLENILTAIGSIAQSIQDVITLGETAFVDAIAEPYTYVMSKFAVFGVIYDYCIGVFDEIFVDDPEPPVIWVDFSKSESDVIQYYGMVKVLDMTWYAEYKPYGDMIVAGILWVFFLWRLFSRIPDIIRGTGMTVHGVAKYDGRRSNSDG